VELHSIRRERRKKQLFPKNQNGGRHGKMMKLPKKYYYPKEIPPKLTPYGRSPM
jgi:hypothetical protein